MSNGCPRFLPLPYELSFARLRQGLQQFAISGVLFPKSAPDLDLRPQSPELDQILRLAS